MTTLLTTTSHTNVYGNTYYDACTPEVHAIDNQHR